MLDLCADNLNPLVLALFPDGKGGGREIGIIEGADGNGDQTVELALDRIMDARAAPAAKMMGDPVAAVGEVGPDLRLPLDRHLAGRPARLDGKCAAGALLAVETVADRNPHRLALAGGGQLAAAAARLARRVHFGLAERWPRCHGQ